MLNFTCNPIGLKMIVFLRRKDIEQENIYVKKSTKAVTDKKNV